MGRPPSDAKDRILDAAEDLVLREGSARLTLDAVAAEAKVSKGGLLYHFPSKDALIQGMVERLIALFHLTHTSIMAADPEPIGRWTRAYLEQMRCAENDPFLARADRVSAALVAASAADPSLLDPLRACYRDWQSHLENDGIDPVSASIVRLAADALWMGGLFAIPGPGPKLAAEVIERLKQMTMPAGGSTEKLVSKAPTKRPRGTPTAAYGTAKKAARRGAK